MRRKQKKEDRRTDSPVNTPERPDDTPNAKPGMVFVPSLGWIALKRVALKSYYYGVAIPQDIEADATIALFDGHIGDREWTNFTRPRMLPVGHTATLFKVSLAVKPTAETRIVDVFSALQFGDLNINIGAVDEFVSEPLSFFPVTLYGEIAERQGDILQPIALDVQLKRDVPYDEQKEIMGALSGIGIPCEIGESQMIDGSMDLRKGLYGSPAFVLYVVLHTITSMPVRAEED